MPHFLPHGWDQERKGDQLVESQNVQKEHPDVWSPASCAGICPVMRSDKGRLLALYAAANLLLEPG